MRRDVLTFSCLTAFLFASSPPAFASCVSERLTPVTLWASGGIHTFWVSAPSDCTWTVQTATPWVSVLTETGVGPGQVQIDVMPNDSTRLRFGSVSVGGQNVELIQANLEEQVGVVKGEVRFIARAGGQVLSAELHTRDAGPIKLYTDGSFTDCLPCLPGTTFHVGGVLAGTGFTSETTIQGTVHHNVYWDGYLEFGGPSLTLPSEFLSDVTLTGPVTVTGFIRAKYDPDALPFYSVSVQSDGMLRYMVVGEPDPPNEWWYITKTGDDGTWIDFNNRTFARPTFASSSASGSAPADAVDGDLATRWINGGSTRAEWFIADLGEPFLADRVLLSSDWTATNFTVLGSFDARHWTPVFTTTTGQRDILNPVFPARYVMLYVPNASFPGQYSLSELSVYGQRPANFALGRGSLASSGQASSFQVTDGNLATSWSSAPSDPEWLLVDLGLTQSLTRLVMRWGSNYATSYVVLTSTDGRTWAPVFYTTAGAGGNQEVSLPSVDARYVMVYGISRLSSAGGYVLTELEAY